VARVGGGVGQRRGGMAAAPWFRLSFVWKLPFVFVVWIGDGDAVCGVGIIYLDL
jgi:hypothetical protein